MKNILVINGHPDKQSFCFAIAEEYKNIANQFDINCKVINLIDLEFNPILQHGFRTRTELEPDLLNSIQLIKEAHHIVWVYPNWWATFPALLKGFIDRIFLPGIFFEYIPNSLMHKKLLKGKSARIIVTMDSPKWYYKLFLKNSGHNAIKKGVLQFCGINPVKITTFTPIKYSNLTQRNKWLKFIATLVKKDINLI